MDDARSGLLVEPSLTVPRLEEHLRAMRARGFAGRAAELRRFRAALAMAAGPFSVLHLHGPGGIGKSALLRRFADEAREARREAVLVDCYGEDAGVQAFLTAAEAVLRTERPVLLIDSLDRWDLPRHWLRDVFLPIMPSGSVVVLAGRQAPEADWLAEPGWAGVLRALPLDDLTPDEVAVLLDAYDLGPAQRAAVAAFGGGNPLALHVSAQAAARRPLAISGHAVARTVLSRIVGELPSPDHRRALEVCAHALTTTEELLRVALPEADAASLFDWLCELPFIEPDERGLHPRDVVRRMLESELRWRDPQTYGETHTRIRTHLVEQVRTAADDTVLAAITELTYAQRAQTAKSYVFDRDAGLEDDHFRPADRAAVLDIAERVEGAESRDLAEFWLDRQPGAFRVQRRGSEVRAFFARLVIAQPGADELADPVLAHAWDHTRAVAPLGPGEHLAVIRFAIDPAAYQRPSPAMDLMQLRWTADMIRDDRLTWIFFATPDPVFWEPIFAEYCSGEQVAAASVGGRDYTLLATNWREREPDEWHERADDLMLSRRPASAAGRALTGPRMARADFDLAVRDALRCWRRPDLLADNRLIGSRLIVDGTAETPVAALRDELQAALTALGSDSRQAKYQRALTATFLSGAATQEAAAERLGLPFSTYRRHLTRGLEAVCNVLWKKEMYGIAWNEAQE